MPCRSSFFTTSRYARWRTRPRPSWCSRTWCRSCRCSVRGQAILREEHTYRHK
jgi:hypothetical protein